MKTIWKAMVGGCLMLAVTALPARADEAPAVTASGFATTKVQPDVLRVKLLVTADGKDAQSALAALAPQVDAAKKALTALKPAGEVSADAPALGAGPMSQQQRQEMEMQRFENSRGRHAAPAAPKVTVFTTVTAEWALGAGGGDALVSATKLEDQIKAAIPKPAAKPKTPEEEEQAEEAQQNGSENDPTAMKPGQAKFLFVHKLTSQDRSQATADALANAKSDAEQLAAAIGKPLGAVNKISFANGNYTSEYYEYMRGMADEDPGASRNEVVSDQPGPMTYAVQVVVSYGFGADK